MTTYTKNVLGQTILSAEEQMYQNAPDGGDSHYEAMIGDYVDPYSIIAGLNPDEYAGKFRTAVIDMQTLVQRLYDYNEDNYSGNWDAQQKELDLIGGMMLSCAKQVKKHQYLYGLYNFLDSEVRIF
jgi:hypothetical protein